MKKSLVMLWCLITFSCACFAQDVIVTKDSKKINAKVTEVNVDDIKYKNFDNQDGPTYTLSKSNIVSIVYQNGTVETFETENAKPAQVSQTTQAYNQRTVQRPVNIVEDMKAKNYPLYQQYANGERQSTLGIILLISGGILEVGGFACLLAGSHEELREAGGVLAVAGGICLSIGIPVSIIGGARKNNAIREYGRRYYGENVSPHLQLNVHGNGLGLAYVF